MESTALRGRSGKIAAHILPRQRHQKPPARPEPPHQRRREAAHRSGSGARRIPLDNVANTGCPPRRIGP